MLVTHTGFHVKHVKHFTCKDVRQREILPFALTIAIVRAAVDKQQRNGAAVLEKSSSPGEELLFSVRDTWGAVFKARNTERRKQHNQCDPVVSQAG